MRAVPAFLFPAILMGCASMDKPATPRSDETMVTVDSRIELMSAIQLMSGYFLVSYLDSDYKSDVLRYFEPCKNHPAVSKFTELSSNGFDFSTVPDAFIALSEPPTLRQRYPARPEIIESAGGAANYAEFLGLIRAFADDCGFKAFYDTHHQYYDRLVGQSRSSVASSVGVLTTYFGMPLGSTEVVLGPLLHDGGFATRYDSEAGEPIAYAFIGPVGLSEGETTFGSAERLQPLVAHEFAHTVINRLTAKFSSDVSANRGNFQLVALAMRQEGYTSWEQVVNESIIRALTARLTTLERGEEAGEAEIAEEVKRGFIFVPALVTQFERYENQRHRYPTIEDFYPSLLEVFRTKPN